MPFLVAAALALFVGIGAMVSQHWSDNDQVTQLTAAEQVMQAPDAEEVISYRMPAFKRNGILVYFAAFKNHIGLYPPVSGDEKLLKAVAPYAGEKGNLRFPLDRPIPYELIERIVRHRMKPNQEKATSKRKEK